MQPFRIVFAGTPEFAVPSLAALLDSPLAEVVAVYTQPDRPAGRGRRVTASPVKRLAAAHGLPVVQPPTLRDAAAVDTLAAWSPDLLVVAAYGLILPADVLGIPEVPLNVHASLLPRWRGAAPIQRAIMAGDATTGISIMRVVEALDAGPVWLTRSCPIGPTDTGGTLHDRLAALGAEALLEALEARRAGRVSESPQDDAAATYAHKLSATDRRIEWADAAADIERRVRALAPAPGAQTRLAGIDVRILGVTVDDATGLDAGEVRAAGGRLLVGTGAGTLAITELQPQGKQPMDAAAFLNGYGRRL